MGREVAFNRLTTMQNDGMLQSIFIPFSEINSPLKSETSLNINVGIKFRPNEKVSCNINFFKNWQNAELMTKTQETAKQFVNISMQFMN